MREIRFAIKAVLPIVLSYIFIGIAFGIMINKEGYSILWACLSGIFIYAGSMQIVMISLLASNVPLYVVAITSFFINARHMFYGIGFVNKFREMGWRYPYMVLSMTDETYSVLCSITHPEDMDEGKINFYIALICHMVWILSCTVGAWFGQTLAFDMKGIEFSATALFVCVCVNQWRQFDSHIPAITGFISAMILLFILDPDKFLLPALSVSLIVLTIMRERITSQMGGMNHDN